MYNLDFLFTSLVYGNATFNNISVICSSQFYWWRKPRVPVEKLFFYLHCSKLVKINVYPFGFQNTKKITRYHCYTIMPILTKKHSIIILWTTPQKCDQ